MIPLPSPAPRIPARRPFACIAGGPGAVVVLLVALLTGVPRPAVAQDEAQVRLKELLQVENMAVTQLTGYGLVVGLDRTGDRARGTRGSPYTVQSITNMLQRFGIAVDPALLSSRNAAAVLVTATLDPFSGPGTALDATVSSIGDARSISGGVLIQTPLVNPSTGELHAFAQGPISTGGVLASSEGSSVKINHSNTGRVPNGALVTREMPAPLTDVATLGLVMKRPDFTNVTRIAEAINAVYPDAAEVEHAGLIRMQVPPETENIAGLMANLEGLTVAIDAPARLVVNERSGIIVAGGNVRISEVMVTYGSIVISTQTDPFVSQPLPFGEGETVEGAVGTATVEESGAQSVVLTSTADVNQLAAALNELGLSARDVIGIFQAIDRAGALQGELVIL